MIFRVFILLFLGLLPIRNTFGQVIRYDTKINIDDKDRKSTERIFLIQINDKKGNWLSHIEISHNPKQEFSLNYAKILDLHGNELRKLKRKDVDTKNDLSHQAFYQDDLLTEFDLYWNQYPYQVEYSYTIAEDEFLYITHWTPVNYSEISTVQATLSISTPSDYAIHINQTDNLSFEDTAIEDRKELKWSASMIDLPDREIYAPPMSELLPAVSIVPANIKYGVVGNCDSWSSFGLWFDHLNRGTDELPLSEKTLIHKLLENVADKKETVKKLYHYLQDHTHYINVAIDVGGLKSYPASYVSRKKYGDCKALTTYMKSMLKSVGIESYYTVIHAGTNNTKINEQFPSQ